MSAQLATAVSTNDEMEALSRRLCDEVAAWRFEYSRPTSSPPKSCSFSARLVSLAAERGRPVSRKLAARQRAGELSKRFHHHLLVMCR